MSILQTEVLPIEYDNKTEQKAKKIKKVLEKNPEFFRVFLQGEKISCIDKNSSLYIKKGQSILKYLDGISAYDATGFLRKNYLRPKQEIQVLYYLIGEDNLENKLKSNRGKILGAYDFFHEKKDYKELKKYIQNNSKITQEEIDNWLRDKNRYLVSEYLLENALFIVQQGYIDYIDQEAEEALDTLIYLSDELSNLVDYETPEQTPNYFMTPVESKALFKEFLTVIDPSLHLLKVAKEIEESNKIIDDPSDVRICDNEVIKQDPMNCYSLYGNDGQKYLYISLKHTIEDAVALTHEFFHYLADEENSIYVEGSTLAEFSPIFFETLMCQFLISKNYPKEEIDKIVLGRKIFTTKVAINCRQIFIFFKQILKNTPIDIENEINYLVEDGIITEEDSYGTSCKLADISCDERNKELSENIYHPLELVMYLLGYEYAEIALKKLESNPNIIPNMIYLAENLEQTSMKKALENAEIIESSPQKIKKDT